MTTAEAFDIYLCRNGRWTLDFRAEARDQAESLAVKALTRPGVEGIRVVRDYFQALNNIHKEEVVFERRKNATKDAGLNLGTVSDVPPCETPDDLYSGPALATISRLYGAYISKFELTALEVLHLDRQFEHAMDTGAFFRDGLAKLATARSRTGGGDHDQIRDSLNRLAARTLQAAKQVAATELPSPGALGLDVALADVHRATPNEHTAGYLLRVAMARDLASLPHRWAKLVTVAMWADEATGDDAARAADSVLADLLGQPDVVAELLGGAPDFGASLCQLIDLAAGNLTGADDDDAAAPEHPDYALQTIARLMVDGRLPDSRAVLLDNIRRSLIGKRALSRDPDQGWKRFDSIVQRLTLDLEVLGGPEMAAAMVARAATFEEAGGATGLNRAIFPILVNLWMRRRQIGFLITLWESGIAETVGLTLRRYLNKYLFGDTKVHNLVPENLEPLDVMRAMTAIHRRVEAASIDDAWTATMLGRIDELLVNYIEQDRILEQIDHSEAPLHIRAFMLVRICQPGVLPKGRALELASNRILSHLRRPRFEQELVVGIADPTDQERLVRDFHAELQKSVLIGA